MNKKSQFLVTDLPSERRQRERERDRQTDKLWVTGFKVRKMLTESPLSPELLNISLPNLVCECMIMSQCCPKVLNVIFKVKVIVRVLRS